MFRIGKARFCHPLYGYAFRWDGNGAKTVQDICVVYGKDAAAKTVTQECFDSSKNRNLNLENGSRFARLSALNIDNMRALKIAADRTAQELTKEVELQ